VSTCVDDPLWRYILGGAVVHAIPHDADPLAVCGTDVRNAANWHGAGTQAEYERAAGLPRCRRCLRKVGET
jgi:hypothetical protein